MKLIWRKKITYANLPDGLRYRAFLSYRTSDKKQAEWLHRKIENYRVPRQLIGKEGRHGMIPERVGPIFRDRDDARAAHDIETIITYELSRSLHLIVLCSPRTREKESWVGREIEIFKQQRTDAEIYAVIGDGEPPNCFPNQLISQDENGIFCQPLAADLRHKKKGGDGKNKAVIKLIAALIGTDFDNLWQRDQRRRRVRNGFIALIIMIVSIYSESVWWINKYDLPFGYSFIKPLWNIGLFTPLPTMVNIPPGKFIMGCLSGRDNVEFQCSDDEKPDHQVTFNQEFSIGKYEVTFLEYDYYVWDEIRSGNKSIEFPLDQGRGRYNKPVGNVSWDDAKVYLKWLSKKTKKPFRLPTEAEWEYSARAGTKTAYWWGNYYSDNSANCKGNSAFLDKHKIPSDAGEYSANPWGLYDTVGNIFEWVEDFPRYYSSSASGKAIVDKENIEEDKNNRILRGGSWTNDPFQCRPSYRISRPHDFSNFHFGFRVLTYNP
jgi:formylglycine-generating enzyme required for sulfatase activity